MPEPDPKGEGLLKIPVSLSVVIAKKTMALEDILHLSNGSVVEFDKSHKDAIDLVVGGKTIAHGEAIVLRDKFGILVKQVGSAEETLDKLRGELDRP